MPDYKYINKQLSIEDVFGWRAMWIINKLNRDFQEAKLHADLTEADIGGLEGLVKTAQASFEVVLHECGIMQGFDCEYETIDELKKTDRAQQFVAECLDCIKEITPMRVMLNEVAQAKLLGLSKSIQRLSTAK